MPETRYTLPVWIDTRIRHYHRTERGRVVAFMVQLEVEVENEWRFTRLGKRTKERLSLTRAEALTRAERDIKQNWAVYRQRFLSGGPL